MIYASTKIHSFKHGFMMTDWAMGEIAFPLHSNCSLVVDKIFIKYILYFIKILEYFLK